MMAFGHLKAFTFEVVMNPIICMHLCIMILCKINALKQLGKRHGSSLGTV